MQPAGTAAVNSDYITQLTDQINGISGTGACAELQSVVNAAAASIEAQLTAIRAQIAALTPIVTIPGASPGAIVSWITSFVAPYVKAITTFEAQLATTLSEVAALETAIANAASRLTSCSITIPPMT